MVNLGDNLKVSLYLSTSQYAYEYCLKDGGALLRIPDYQTMAELSRLMAVHDPASQVVGSTYLSTLWIDGVGLYPGRVWTTYDGTPLRYLPWSNGRPISLMDQRCIRASTYSSHVFWDTCCRCPFKFVCQYNISYKPEMPSISPAIFDEVYYADTPDCRRNKQTTSLTTSPLMSVVPRDAVRSQIKSTVGRAKYTTYLENVTEELSAQNVTNENFTPERTQHITFWEDASKTSSGDNVTSESLVSDSGENKLFRRGTDEFTSDFITEYEINASGSEVKVSDAEPFLYVDWNSTAQNDEKLYEKTKINKLKEDDTVNTGESTLREQNGGVSNKITMSENAANEILTRTRENMTNTLTNKETSTKLNSRTRNTVNAYDSMIPMGMFFSRGVDECNGSNDAAIVIISIGVALLVGHLVFLFILSYIFNRNDKNKSSNNDT